MFCNRCGQPSGMGRCIQGCSLVTQPPPPPMPRPQHMQTYGLPMSHHAQRFPMMMNPPQLVMPTGAPGYSPAPGPPGWWVGHPQIPSAPLQRMNPLVQPQQVYKKPWNCPKCANHNFALRDVCNRCKFPRPLVPQGSTTGFAPSRRPGDWSCVKCNFHNFASRALCYKCDTQKPPGAMRPGDWICECKSHNYVNRETCFRCQKPKPIVSEDHSKASVSTLILPTPPALPKSNSNEKSSEEVLQPLNDNSLSSRSKSVCFEYHQGRCLRGQDCQYLHTYEDQSSASQKVSLKRPLEIVDTANSGGENRSKLQKITHSGEIVEGNDPKCDVYYLL